MQQAKKVYQVSCKSEGVEVFAGLIWLPKWPRQDTCLLLYILAMKAQLCWATIGNGRYMGHSEGKIQKSSFYKSVSTWRQDEGTYKTKEDECGSKQEGGFTTPRLISRSSSSRIVASLHLPTGIHRTDCELHEIGKRNERRGQVSNLRSAPWLQR